MIAIRIHTLEQALAASQWAAEHDILVSLVSPKAAGNIQGIGWWLALVAQMPAHIRCILDCGNHRGLVFEALSNGVPIIGHDELGQSLTALKEIAEQTKALMMENPSISLDLLGASREGSRKILLAAKL